MELPNGEFRGFRRYRETGETENERASYWLYGYNYIHRYITSNASRTKYATLVLSSGSIPGITKGRKTERTWYMKVGDLIKPINVFRTDVFQNQRGKMEIVQISTKYRILVKYYDRSTKEVFRRWESADEFVVDVQRTREERLKELGIE
jgi:hypothetical protein